MRSYACALALFVTAVLANTESILLQIPHYYDIPSHPQGYNSSIPVSPIFINDTFSVIADYPIGDKYSQPVDSSVSVGYHEALNEQHTLLVKLNNYADSTFTSDDSLYVKLCWPATEPFSIDLSYKFLANVDSKDVLDIYVVVAYVSKAFSLESAASSLDTLKFNLHVTKLPWFPVPIEIIYLVTYLVDVLIIVIWVLLPFLRKYI